MSSQRAASGHVLRCAHLLRELQHRVLLLGEKTELSMHKQHMGSNSQEDTQIACFISSVLKIYA